MLQLAGIENLTTSKEWVYHETPGQKEATLVRKYQKVVWDRLFGHLKPPIMKSVVYELNTRWLPAGNLLVAFDKKNPEEFLATAQELLEGTDYEIHISLKAKSA